MRLDIQAINSLLVNNMVGVMGFLLVMTILMLILLINAYYNLAYLKKRYRKMMTGVDDGANLERMLIGHIDETKAVAEENVRIDKENKRIDALLQKAITRTGVVRFSAFSDMGSDLSYAVALLDSHNDGLIFSSIFGRDDSRCYVKPVVNGASTYKLTAEEEEALQEAMQKG